MRAKSAMSGPMKRRTLLGLGALAGIGACATREMTMGNDYYSGPVSDHFDGTRFFNPDGAAPKGLGALLRWQFGGNRADWPDDVAVAQVKPDAGVGDLRVTMVGHATVLIQADGRNVLLDPVWSKRVSPVSFAGPARVTAPGIAFADLPRIDAVLLNHNHYDHMDVPTLRRLHDAHAMPVLTPLGNDTILRRAIDGVDARAGDWGDVLEGGGVSARLLRAHHWSARGPRDRSHALWCSFALQTPAGRIFVSGDTGYDRGRPYAEAAKHGPYRLAIIPIGAYAPRWFMHDQHQNPEEAVAGFEACGAENALGHHWGTFQLTNESREEPPVRLAEALDARGIARERFRTLPPGGVWDLTDA